MVVSTNLGGDKTNWFVTKVVNHKLEKSGDKWLRTVNIVYTYNQPAGEFAPLYQAVQRLGQGLRSYWF
ncbi:MAG: hypothetical protein KatS3mg101_0363 [Patescibacteria group bacterium]|nr:MAG: hypothetical protein KatS3mg101_0363 [Patescibacteria group bacterium]